MEMRKLEELADEAADAVRQDDEVTQEPRTLYENVGLEGRVWWAKGVEFVGVFQDEVCWARRRVWRDAPTWYRETTYMDTLCHLSPDASGAVDLGTCDHVLDETLSRLRGLG